MKNADRLKFINDDRKKIPVGKNCAAGRRLTISTKINSPKSILKEKNFALLKPSEGLKACAAKCPHAGGEMACGKLDAKENIVCPVHGYIFNLHNGRD